MSQRSVPGMLVAHAALFGGLVLFLGSVFYIAFSGISIPAGLAFILGAVVMMAGAFLSQRALRRSMEAFEEELARIHKQLVERYSTGEGREPL